VTTVADLRRTPAWSSNSYSSDMNKAHAAIQRCPLVLKFLCVESRPESHEVCPQLDGKVPPVVEDTLYGRVENDGQCCIAPTKYVIEVCPMRGHYKSSENYTRTLHIRNGVPEIRKRHDNLWLHRRISNLFRQKANQRESALRRKCVQVESRNSNTVKAR